MAALADIYALSIIPAFQHRVQASVISYALTIAAEVASEVQTITTTGSPTGGTFTLTFSGQTTGTIVYNATATVVQSALTALSTIGIGNMVCTGGPLPTGVACTFAGTLAGLPQVLMTHTDSLTGGSSPVAVVTRSTPGASFLNHTGRLALARTTLGGNLFSSALAKAVSDQAIMQIVLGVACDTTVQSDYGAAGVNGVAAVTDAHINASVAALWNNYI